MRTSRFNEEQIASALKQAELDTKVDEICRKVGISDATFYKWRQKPGGLAPSELKRLRQLEEGNNKLKRLVADLMMRYGASMRKACAAIGLSRVVY